MPCDIQLVTGFMTDAFKQFDVASGSQDAVDTAIYANGAYKLRMPYMTTLYTREIPIPGDPVGTHKVYDKPFLGYYLVRFVTHEHKTDSADDAHMYEWNTRPKISINRLFVEKLEDYQLKDPKNLQDHMDFWYDKHISKYVHVPISSRTGLTKHIATCLDMCMLDIGNATGAPNQSALPILVNCMRQNVAKRNKIIASHIKKFLQHNSAHISDVRADSGDDTDDEDDDRFTIPDSQTDDMDTNEDTDAVIDLNTMPGQRAHCMDRELALKLFDEGGEQKMVEYMNHFINFDRNYAGNVGNYLHKNLRTTNTIPNMENMDGGDESDTIGKLVCNRMEYRTFAWLQDTYSPFTVTVTTQERGRVSRNGTPIFREKQINIIEVWKKSKFRRDISLKQWLPQRVDAGSRGEIQALSRSFKIHTQKIHSGYVVNSFVPFTVSIPDARKTYCRIRLRKIRPFYKVYASTWSDMTENSDPPSENISILGIHDYVARVHKEIYNRIVEVTKDIVDDAHGPTQHEIDYIRDNDPFGDNAHATEGVLLSVLKSGVYLTWSGKIRRIVSVNHGFSEIEVEQIHGICDAIMEHSEAVVYILSVYAIWRHMYVCYCNKDSLKYRYMMDWLLYARLCPQHKNKTVLCIKGLQGFGKSMVMRKICNALYSPHVYNCTMDSFKSDYTSQFGMKKMVLIDEGDESGANRKGRLDDYSAKLKNMITEEVIEIHEKYKAREQVRTHAGYIMCTNVEPVLAKDPSQRRIKMYRMINPFIKRRKQNYFTYLASALTSDAVHVLFSDYQAYNHKDNEVSIRSYTPKKEDAELPETDVHHDTDYMARNIYWGYKKEKFMFGDVTFMRHEGDVNIPSLNTNDKLTYHTLSNWERYLVRVIARGYFIDPEDTAYRHVDNNVCAFSNTYIRYKNWNRRLKEDVNGEPTLYLDSAGREYNWLTELCTTDIEQGYRNWASERSTEIKSTNCNGLVSWILSRICTCPYEGKDMYKRTVVNSEYCTKRRDVNGQPIRKRFKSRNANNMVLLPPFSIFGELVATNLPNLKQDMAWDDGMRDAIRLYEKDLLEWYEHFDDFISDDN